MKHRNVTLHVFIISFKYHLNDIYFIYSKYLFNQILNIEKNFLIELKLNKYEGKYNNITFYVSHNYLISTL